MSNQPRALELAHVLPQFGGATCYEAASLLRLQHEVIGEMRLALEQCLKKGARWHPADPTASCARAALARAKELEGEK